MVFKPGGKNQPWAFTGTGYSYNKEYSEKDGRQYFGVFLKLR